MFGDYSRNVSEAKCKIKYGKGLEILTTKQMLQRLPIALAQVKTDAHIRKLIKWNQKNNIFFV